MSEDNKAIVAEAEAAVKTLNSVKSEIAKSVFGQEEVIELALSAILAGGHALLIGAPGLAKTRLVEATAVALGLNNNRIQFTPDLMPSDIIGSEVLDEAASGERNFRFVKGPVFTQLLMADEINRASPRTQSDLLQAMQEREVSVAGERHKLPAPFHVLATQNPIEQLDRFLLKIDVTYPDLDTERKILVETTGLDEEEPKAALSAQELIKLQALVRKMPVGEKIVEAILKLIREARPEQSSDDRVQRLVDWGPSPRAGQALMLAARSRALLRGRLAPSLEDVEALAEPALGHRMAMRYDPTGDAPALEELINDLARQAA
jgi:MoxR-like ATPase